MTKILNPLTQKTTVSKISLKHLVVMQSISQLLFQQDYVLVSFDIVLSFVNVPLYRKTLYKEFMKNL